MEKYCIFCGQSLEHGSCANPQCRVNRKKKNQAPQPPSLRKPMSLRDRLRQIREAKEKEKPEEEEIHTPEYEDSRSAIGIVPYDEDESYPAPVAKDPPKPAAEENKPSATKPTEASKTPPAEKEPPTTTETDKAVAPKPDKAVAPKTDKAPAPKENAGASQDSPSNLSLFLGDYFGEPGKVVAAAARKRDVWVGIFLILVSVMASALGTLLFGIIHLEDFFAPWIVCGFFVPLLTYGFGLLYGYFFARFSPVGKERGERGEKIPFGELFATVTVSGVLPNLLLLLSGVIAPVDKSLKVFQFFALLITVCWLVCLIFSLFTVYGGGFSMGGMIITVIFVFLALLAMRCLWVWYLTGELGFSLYIPLSIFLT